MKEYDNIDLIAEFVSWLADRASEEAHYPCNECPAAKLCRNNNDDCEDTIKKYIKGAN